MTAATYVAELLLWSSANLIWEISLGCALIFAWRAWSKPPAAQRHAVAIAMLGSLPVLLIANVVIAHTSLVANAREGSLGALDAHAHASLGLVSAVFQRGASALPVLLVIWCAGVTLAIARILHERRSAHILCERLDSAPRDIARQVEALALRAGVASRVRVLLGDSACGGPFVAGARHPVLVLPAVQLNQDEWNALILHELAHIRRRDYMMNEALRIWGRSSGSIRACGCCKRGRLSRARNAATRKRHAGLRVPSRSRARSLESRSSKLARRPHLRRQMDRCSSA